MTNHSTSFVRWFEDISMDDIALVGGKGASLGEMVHSLSSKGIPVPKGFAVTADAYRYFLEENGLLSPIQKILQKLHHEDIGSLQESGQEIRRRILAANIPAPIQQAIVHSYRELSRQRGGVMDVAVRSSATAEDLPEASFAGQHESFLNIHGEEALLQACKQCYASLFTDRAISYRQKLGYDHLSIALSVCVQTMVRSDLACSGVMFTIDTESGFPDIVLINSAFGLGENVVKGAVNPDEFLVFKGTLASGARPILMRSCGSKERKLIYNPADEREVINVDVPLQQRKRFSLEDDEILTLARWGCIIEQHYSERHGRPVPMDIEWAKDGRSGELFILQARPETVHSEKDFQVLNHYKLKESGEILLQGSSIGDKIASGPVRVVNTVDDIKSLQDGEILVVERTDPDWEPAMKRASAVVTNSGGRTCHAAIISREFGVPAIVGTQHATTVLKTGDIVTVSCAEGESGKVFKGAVPYEIECIELKNLPKPRTQMMINISNPHRAPQLSFLPHQGVGLARIEFIIANSIGIHPLALLDFEKLDGTLKEEISLLTERFDDKSEFFVSRLAEGIGMIAAAFYPKDVIVRFSDFKTNEYANLVGGRLYEPTEENPMLGFRGASRYYHPSYRRGFALECQAIAMVRNEMGLKNVKVMIPFCRTVQEGQKVLESMAEHGLVRGHEGLEVYLMCEIPSNVVLAEDFAGICDGFSIGSNDLTQLILGVDRDSSIVAPLFDERNPAVLRMVADVIQRVKKCGKKIGICGQAPSDYPEFTKFLVEQGIDSISLNADSLIRALTTVSEAEARVSKS